MGLLADIARTYLDPAGVLRRKRGENPGENILLAYLLFACLISFLVRLPGLLASNPATQGPTPDQTLPALVGATFVATLLFAPLFFYLLSVISHVLARLLGRQGAMKDARLALFWTLLALQPLVIASVVVGNMLPPPMPNILSALAGLFFLATWLRGLHGLYRR